MSLSLPRQNLANWVIKGSSLLEPLYNKMHEILLQKEVLHADETTLEVLCEPDRPAQTKSFMWLYRTSGCDKPIILYDYQEGRSGSFAEKFLQGFHGYLHTDGWGGYHRLEPNITLCGCWSHARRRFDEALSILPQNALNQKKYLIAFLDDGRIELSNNRAERSIKPFVIGRKNWLFCCQGGDGLTVTFYPCNCLPDGNDFVIVYFNSRNDKNR